MAALYRRTAPAAVLDLGCGDARVPAGAATAVDPRPRFDLVEPSAELISEAGVAVRDAGLDARLHQSTAQDFLGGVAHGEAWDLAQATFALHVLPPENDDRSSPASGAARSASW